MHLAWNDWHEPLANTPDSMLPLPFTFNVSDVGLKPYAATPAPETAAAASFCSWICQISNCDSNKNCRYEQEKEAEMAK